MILEFERTSGAGAEPLADASAHGRPRYDQPPGRGRLHGRPVNALHVNAAGSGTLSTLGTQALQAPLAPLALLAPFMRLEQCATCCGSWPSKSRTSALPSRP